MEEHAGDLCTISKVLGLRCRACTHMHWLPMPTVVWKRWQLLQAARWHLPAETSPASLSRRGFTCTQVIHAVVLPTYTVLPTLMHA